MEKETEPTFPFRRALLIDDVPRVARAFIAGLSTDGWWVDWVEDGGKALHHLRETTYDLLVTRLVIPGESILPIVRRIRESNPSVSIVVWSSLWRGRIRHRLDHWGCQTLRGPLRPYDLLDRTRAVAVS